MEQGTGKLNMLAIVSVGVAAVGLILIVAADSILDNAETDYYEGRMSISDYRDTLDTAGTIWLWGEITIGVGVVIVAIAVVNKEPGEFRAMRSRLEKDFYRKCPSCNSWNTKFVPNCTTCGILLPPLSEFQKIQPGPTSFREGP
jgi:hypothetical protein